MGYICTRCGGTKVACEAIVNPNTREIIDYFDESFEHAICGDCENEVIISNVEEVKHEIDLRFHEFVEKTGKEPEYVECQIVWEKTGIHKIQDMERLNFETLFRIVRWDYNRCFKDESLDKDLFVEKYGRVMGEHYYNKFVHEFDGNILKMVGYFRGSEKEGQVFCDMITERIEKYEQRESYNRSKLNN